MPEATTTQTMNKRKRGIADDPSARPAPAFKDGESVPQYNVDESAMSQLSAFNNQEVQQNGGTNAAASDTAAAALHYPIASDAAFQTQASTGDYPETSYGLDQLKESPTQVQAPQQSPSVGATPSKPAVGSEEWHKIRKDNHKEGEYLRIRI
jgi:bHLH factor